MSIGLLGLLDDVAGIAKMAAASVDDVAGMAAKAGVKATGAVIDDAAVTPRYIEGASPARELPIVGKIALGSLRNKLIFLLPAALILSFFLPGVITPLLMLGGTYLCYEGAEKVFHALAPHAAESHEQEVEPAPSDPRKLEEEKVAGAIKTDFILSAEIMTIALAAIPTGNIVTQAAVLAIVGIGITAMVYGGVALIVKADDVGLFLAQNARTGWMRALGRAIVRAMPTLLTWLGIVGTAAMLWVGGGIIVHGLASFGLHWPEEIIVHFAEGVAHYLEAIAGFVAWFLESAAYGVLGLVLGTIVIPIAQYIIAPAWAGVTGLFRRG